MKVAIIGGGPSGLVTLKYLCEAHQSLGCEPVEAVLFEYQNDVGGTFLARAYEDAELVSSRQLTCFSDFRHTSLKEFLAASDLARGPSQPRHRVPDGWTLAAVGLRCGCHLFRPARGAERPGDQRHQPRTEGHALVAVQITQAVRWLQRGDGGGPRRDRGGCGVSGGHPSRSRPSRPLPQERVPFAPKRNPGPVLLPILGRVPNPAEPGIPIDVSRANLFDTAYVHRILRQKDDWLWEYYRLYITVLLWLSSGTTAGMDQWAGEISPARHHPSMIFFNKSMKVCPYISLPYRPQVPGRRLWLYALRSALVQTPVEDTNGRYVDLAPWPLQVQPSGFVEFVDNGRPEYQKMKERQARPDMMVLCTGYKQSFPFLDRQSNPPYATPDTANIRRIWERSDPSVGFIGFVRPSLGAIPPLSEMQAQLWIAHLLARHCIPRPPHPQDEWHYRLRSVPGARVQYGVDHESYVYQLALDMGSAPGLTDVVRLGSLKLLLVWALGANFNTKFRLRGP